MSEFVCDRRGEVWRIVRDGGMAVRATASGEIESAGVTWLAASFGPLVNLDLTACPSCGHRPATHLGRYCGNPPMPAAPAASAVSDKQARPSEGGRDERA